MNMTLNFVSIRNIKIKSLLKWIIPLAILSSVILLLKGCEVDYDKLNLKKKNPTSYIYNTNIKELKEIIYKSKKDFDRTLNGEGYQIESITEDTAIFNRYKDQKEKFNNDLIYDWFSGVSKIYVSSEEAISYSADFHLHFTEINDYQTKVEIFTINPKINVRLKTIISHAPGFYNTYEVEPSSIEEYLILKVIGEKLGDTTMPEVKLPDKR